MVHDNVAHAGVVGLLPRVHDLSHDQIALVQPRDIGRLDAERLATVADAQIALVLSCGGDD